MIGNRTLDVVPFIPAFVTLVVQLLAFAFVRAMIARAFERLAAAGIKGGQRTDALKVMQEFALAAQLFTGGLAVLFALQLTAAAAAGVDRGLQVGIAIATVGVYAGLALLAPVWDHLYDRINDHPDVRLPWHARLVLILRMRDYGTLLTWTVIIVTLAAQVVTAFLGLQVASSTGPAVR